MTVQTNYKTTLKISDDYMNRLQELIERVRDSQLEIGDILIELIELYEDREGVLKYISGALNYSYELLQEYENAARRWTAEKRLEYPLMDWSFYRNADPNDPRDIELLNQAIDEGWNVTTFKEHKYPAIVQPYAMVGKALGVLQKVELQDARLKENLDNICIRLENLKHLIREYESPSI